MAPLEAHAAAGIDAAACGVKLESVCQQAAAIEQGLDLARGDKAVEQQVETLLIGLQLQLQGRGLLGCRRRKRSGRRSQGLGGRLGLTCCWGLGRGRLGQDLGLGGWGSLGSCRDRLRGCGDGGQWLSACWGQGHQQSRSHRRKCPTRQGGRGHRRSGNGADPAMGSGSAPDG